MTVRKVATVTLGAAVSAAFAGLLAASPAQAACASFWGMGNTTGCTSTFGNAAVVTGDTGGRRRSAASASTPSRWATTRRRSARGSSAPRLTSGKTATQRRRHGEHRGWHRQRRQHGSSATAVGLFNRAINIGNGNKAVAISGSVPKVDLAGGNIDIGNNTVMNIGNDNFAAVGSVAPGLPGGFSNGVYKIGNRNMGVAGGVLSNLIQIGDDNYTPVKVPVPYESVQKGSYAPYITIPTPNTAVGLGAEAW